jgi:hypothetical protein
LSTRPTRNAPRVVRSLAFQLATRLPDYRKLHRLFVDQSTTETRAAHGARIANRTQDELTRNWMVFIAELENSPDKAEEILMRVQKDGPELFKIVLQCVEQIAKGEKPDGLDRAVLRGDRHGGRPLGKG